MARRAFVPPIVPPPESTSRMGGGVGVARSSPDGGLRPSTASSIVVPPPRPSVPAPPPSAGMPESRRSVPSTSLQSSDGVTVAACSQLLDRLAAADEAPFVASWIESVLSGRARTDPTLAVRLLRAYRETGRIERARELAASLPSALASWNPLDGARLAIERSMLATLEGRCDHAEAELRLASRALGGAPKGTGLREQLDMHMAQAQLELKLNRPANASSALRLAEHVTERIEDGAWRTPAAMALGHIAMRLCDPRAAAKHYAAALARAPARGTAAMSAHGNCALALGSIGRFDDARYSALQAIGIARDLGAGWRHADAYDVLAIVEIAADHPLAALHAIDEGLMVLGETEQATLRYQLAEHRAWALAMLGRAPAARQWLTKAERLGAELPPVDAMDEQDLAATQARTLEACGQLREALAHAVAHSDKLTDAFVTGSLNLVIGRCALLLGDETTARSAVERAALSGDKHGWVFPERLPSLPLWDLALRSGDSRVVRYAERTISLVNAAGAEAPSVRQSDVQVAIPPSTETLDALAEPAEGETLIYVTTPQGVTRLPLSELARAIQGATLVVDTLAHHLRVDDREVSLERRRALEPLVVQLLRRAKEGLSADEILRAAGGPGPESADAEHRVRVLISRVRDLLGDPAAIERVRDAGEYGRTRYRLTPNVRFALVEPLYSSSGG